METLAHRHAFPLPAGTQIGVYQVKRVLTINWFGHRYLAWNHHLGAQVVIEEYFPRALSLRADGGPNVVVRSAQQEALFRYGLDRFLEESEMLIRIEHPNVVRTDSALHANGTFYRVMEHIDGHDLTAACGEEGATMGEHELYLLALQLLEALMPVHEMGYVHGALHPACILRKGNGDAVLQGFGWSQLALAARMQTLPEVLHDGYAAPEQYDCTDPPQASVDLYALGATLYRCIAGRDPVSALQRIAARQNGALEPQPTIALDPTWARYSPALLRNIDAMLSLDRGDRPQSVGEAHDALKQQTSAVHVAEVQKGNSDKRSGGKWPSTKHLPRPALWALIGALAVAGLATVALSSRSPEETPRPSVTLDDSMQVASESPLGEKEVQHEPAAAVSSYQDLLRDNSLSTPASTNEPPSDASPTTARTVGPNASPQSTPATAVTRRASLAGPGESTVPTAVIVSRSAQSSVPVPKDFSTPSKPDTKPSPLISAHPHDGALFVNSGNDLAIERHLAAAKEHLAALRLTTPPGDNAYVHFRAVKTLAGDHPKANEGLETIVRRYSWLIRKALVEGRLHRARIYLDRAERVSPSAPVLEELSQALDEAEAQPPGRRNH